MITTFTDLALPQFLLHAIEQLGYNTPTPVQQLCIPPMMDGRDVLGQAQTGTGKTAAFALPILANLQADSAQVQALILTPTRELALQVSEALTQFSASCQQCRIATLYGGAEYGKQLRDLRRGAHIVVATPGRLIDHIKRGSVDLATIRTFVIDEADEMLRMGFIDDVEWLLQRLPAKHQTALFSATMPKAIRQVAKKYLHAPAEVSIKASEKQLAAIEQSYIKVAQQHKVEVLLRYLEKEETDGVIIFVNRKQDSDELAKKLLQSGYQSTALHGDIPQERRNAAVEQLKKQQVDILVATDVAARGLDVERISHVINFDKPQNTETYVHRIGRTGRAGRSGTAVTFFTARETFLVKRLERATKQPLNAMAAPSSKEIYALRVARLKSQLQDCLQREAFGAAEQFVQQFQQESAAQPQKIAAAILTLAQLLPKPAKERENLTAAAEDQRAFKGKLREKVRKKATKKHSRTVLAEDREAYRIEIGKKHGIKARNIVGAIANESGLEGRFINDIKIAEHYSTLSLPKGMPKEIFHSVRKAWVCGKQLNLSRVNSH